MPARGSQIIASRYRVLRELGRGGMGVVYLVEHLHTGDQLALKVLLGQAALDPAAIERFKREARASARIKSQHVVTVIDADTAPELDGAPFLVMELLRGSDLQKRLDAEGRLSSDDCIRYLAEAAIALDKSHAIGIIHRDLKPENLFLHAREDGSTTLKILDFGISKFLGIDSQTDQPRLGVTHTGTIMGTPLYMSPEQALGQLDQIGPATDVWALGIITIQLLTGEAYWRADSFNGLLVQILTEPLYRPSERWPFLPKALDAWLERACARDPTQRFASVGEQVAALCRVFDVFVPETIASPSSGRFAQVSESAAPTRSPAQRSKVPLLALSLVGALATAGVTAVILWPKPSAPPAEKKIAPLVSPDLAAPKGQTPLPVVVQPVVPTSVTPLPVSSNLGSGGKRRRHDKHDSTTPSVAPPPPSGPYNPSSP